MNKELKEKWTSSLRSGNFEQGTDYLCRNGKYCCLGVLCEVAGLEKNDNGYNGSMEYTSPYDPLDHECWHMTDDDEPCTACQNAFERVDTELCSGLMTALGLTSEQHSHLIGMNDSDGKSFAEIADWIDTNV